VLEPPGLLALNYGTDGVTGRIPTDTRK
jgi:hypothetical protein